MGSLNSKASSTDDQDTGKGTGQPKSNTKQRSGNGSGKSTEEIEQIVSKMTNGFSESSSQESNRAIDKKQFKNYFGLDIKFIEHLFDFATRFNQGKQKDKVEQRALRIVSRLDFIASGVASAGRESVQFCRDQGGGPAPDRDAHSGLPQ